MVLKVKAAKRSYREILRLQIQEGLRELKRPLIGLFVSALAAGLEVSFSVLFMATIATLIEGHMNEAIQQLIIANMYALGFIFVILGRSELFTEHTTLAVLPVLNGKSSFDSLIRLWAIVWFGNILGASLFSGLIAVLGPALGIIDPHAFFQIGGKLVFHPSVVIMGSAILAGWLMGILSWLVAAAKDTIGQIVLVWLVTFSIGVAGLHHSIVGTAEVLTAVFSHQAISWDLFFRFLVWTTIGNAIGGAFFVAFMKYRHATAGTRVGEKV